MSNLMCSQPNRKFVSTMTFSIPTQLILFPGGIKSLIHQSGKLDTAVNEDVVVSQYC